MEVSFETFRGTKGLSATRLGYLDRSPAYYQKMLTETVDASHFRFGSAVDCLISEPHKFKEQFYVMVTGKPSDAIQEIVEGVLRDLEAAELEPDTLENHSPYIIRNATRVDYGQKWKEDTMLKKVIDTGSEYFNVLVDSKGKATLDSEEFARVERCVDFLKSSEFTRDLINEQEGGDLEWKWQVPIIFEFKGHICKMLLDLIIIDHTDEKIYIYDLKTIGKSIFSFPSSYVKFRYYLQGALFYVGVERGLEFGPTYTIEYPQFIVAEQNSNNLPFLYKMSFKDIEIGTHGGETHMGRKVKGFNQLIDDLQWHLDTDKWDYPREVYESQGVLTLDVFK